MITAAPWVVATDVRQMVVLWPTPSASPNPNPHHKQAPAPTTDSQSSLQANQHPSPLYQTGAAPPSPPSAAPRGVRTRRSLRPHPTLLQSDLRTVRGWGGGGGDLTCMCMCMCVMKASGCGWVRAGCGVGKRSAQTSAVVVERSLLGLCAVLEARRLGGPCTDRRTRRVPLTTTRCAGRLMPIASVEVVHWLGGGRGFVASAGSVTLQWSKQAPRPTHSTPPYPNPTDHAPHLTPTPPTHSPAPARRPP